MKVNGINGQIELTDANIVIKREGFLSVLSKGFAGEKTIPIKSITSIQFKPATFLSGNGFIKFCYGGSVEERGTLKDAVSDDNAVIFSKKSNTAFQELRETIEKRRITEVPAQYNGSIPDAIEKLAALKEKGIISEEEFSQKKKELLERL